MEKLCELTAKLKSDVNKKDAGKVLANEAKCLALEHEEKFRKYKVMKVDIDDIKPILEAEEVYIKEKYAALISKYQALIDQGHAYKLPVNGLR